MRGNHKHMEGFTIVEMLVTLVLAGLFLVFFLQMFRASSAQQMSLVRQAAANDIAKSNLSKFPRTSTITPAYTCDTNTTVASNTNNLMINPNAAGTVILNNSSANREPSTDSTPNLVQEVRAYSPMGCLTTGSPVKIVSRVTYGFTGQQGEAVYATYVQQ